MSENWPPTYPYPTWPPEELGVVWFSFSSIQAGISALLEYGFTKANPTALENQNYFQGVRCDENHPCSGMIVVSPMGLRYPIAYCTGATHKSCLVPWNINTDPDTPPCYDLGWNSGVII